MTWKNWRWRHGNILDHGWTDIWKNYFSFLSSKDLNIICLMKQLIYGPFSHYLFLEKYFRLLLISLTFMLDSINLKWHRRFLMVSWSDSWAEKTLSNLGSSNLHSLTFEIWENIHRHLQVLVLANSPVIFTLWILDWFFNQEKQPLLLVAENHSILPNSSLI